MVKPNSFSLDELLEPLLDTRYSDPTMDAVAKGYRLAGRAIWEAYTSGEKAKHDPLTGLLRKEFWKSDLDNRISAGSAFGIAFMDLDFFKRVNDELGHERGDELLRSFGEYLSGNFMREGDVLSHEQIMHTAGEDQTIVEQPVFSRYGGDEFTATFDLHGNNRRHGTTPNDSMTHEMVHINRVIGGFVESQPDDVKNLGFDISVGFAVWDPQHHVSRDELLDQADISMYADKTSGRQPTLAS